MSSLFGGGGGSSLFGGNNANNNTTATAGQSLFSQPNNSAPSGTSLFGQPAQNNQQNNTNTSSLFGGQNAQQQNNTNTSSLFGSQQPNQQQQSSLFQPSAQPQPSGPAASTFQGFNPLAHASHFPPNLSLAQQQDLARSRLQQAGISGQRADDKTIFDQAGTLLRKWDPQSQDTLLQTYLYNAVSSAYAPFYYKNPEENEDAWEKALASAPKLEKEEGEGLRFVPVLVRGFLDLGKRVEYQATTVKAMQERLHEMNNSLNAVMAAHQQRITVQLESTKRQHSALSQRTLRLAVKLQVLRNRGYALDAAEESLRKQLFTLANSVSDPAFAAREEEIWARMVSLRERARWLDEEGKRLGQQVEQQQEQKVPEYVVEKTKKILRDYDGQLKHLAKELEEVRREYGEWEAGQRRVR